MKNRIGTGSLRHAKTLQRNVWRFIATDVIKSRVVFCHACGELLMPLCSLQKEEEPPTKAMSPNCIANLAKRMAIMALLEPAETHVRISPRTIHCLAGACASCALEWIAQINNSLWYEARELAMLPNKHKGQTSSALLRLTDSKDWNRSAATCKDLATQRAEIHCHTCVQKPRRFCYACGELLMLLRFLQHRASNS